MNHLKRVFDKMNVVVTELPAIKYFLLQYISNFTQDNHSHENELNHFFSD